MLDLRGCGTALVTPFQPDGSLDLDSYRRLVQWQVASGIDFLVPCGTTGESVTLTPDEYRLVVRTCVQTASGRVPVVAGAGGNNTAHVAALARMVEEEGADAILSVSPYYNKPTQDGLVRHFQVVQQATSLPIVVYNVPGRTGCNLLPSTLEALWAEPAFIGVKEAGGNMDQIMDILARRRDGFSVLSGDDALTLPMLALGGDGLISVAGNAIPSEMSALVAAGLQGDLETARRLHFRYLEFMRLNFIESNPIPIKHVLARMGRVDEIYRLPLWPLSDVHSERVDEELRRIGLIE